MAMQPAWIAPSILSANFATLGAEVDAVLEAGADIVHFYVMDNHYVPNLTIGPLVCEALRKHGIAAPIDVHLMVSPVDRIVPDFAAAGATYISFHPEATEHIDRTIELIREHTPDCCALESVIYVQSYKTAILLGAARGAAMARGDSAESRRLEQNARAVQDR